MKRTANTQVVETLLQAALCLSAAACSPTVTLGSECPERLGTCVQPAPLDGDGPDPELDAAVPDAAEPGAPDSGVPDDGGDFPPGFEPLSVRNPDFERNGGLGGDVVLSNLIGELVPIIPAELPNWYACWVLSVNSVSWEFDDTGVPQRVGDYLSFVINNTAVRQKLASPMLAGATYAFEMDVVSQPDNGAELYVAVKGADSQCADGTLLGRSPLITAETGWSTTCVEFTADAEYSHLMIVPGYEGPAPSSSARLLLDTLRQVPSCSPAP